MATLDLAGIALTEVQRFIKAERTADDAINLVFVSANGNETRITVYNEGKILIPYGTDIVLESLT